MQKNFTQLEGTDKSMITIGSKRAIESKRELWKTANIVVQGSQRGSALHMARHAMDAVRSTILRQSATPHRDRGKARGCQELARQYMKSSRMRSPAQWSRTMT